MSVDEEPIMHPADLEHEEDPGGHIADLTVEEMDRLLADQGLKGTGRGHDDVDLEDRFKRGGNFILDQPPTPAAVWGTDDEVLWAEGEELLICGPTGVGKTTLIAQVIKARLGLGDGMVLGWPVAPTSRRVLYLACDRPRQIARAFNRIFTEEDREHLNEHMVFWPGPPPADIAKHPDTLVRLCRQADADTVVIDSIKDVAVGISEDEVGAGYNRAVQATLADGTDVLAAHHQRKASAGGHPPKKIDDVYGSTWVTAGAGSVFVLWGEAGDLAVEMSHLKQPAAQIPKLQIAHDHDAGLSEIIEGFRVMDYLRLAKSGVTAPQVARAMFSTHDVSETQIRKARRALDRLVPAKVHRSDPTPGGPAGTAPAVYTLIDNRAA